MTKDQELLFDIQREEKKRLLEEVAQKVEAFWRERRQAAKEEPSSYDLKVQAERDADNAKPFLERQLWRRRWMYKAWDEEEVIATPTDRSAITRSHYGYEVLNTPDLGVVDIDFNFDYDIDAQQCESLSNLKSWCADHPEQSFRAYRTSKGLRFLRTDAPMALDADYDALCEMVAADEVYRYMCRQEQSCFRVRLSPKPQRIQADWPIWSPYSGWNELPDAETIRNYENAARAFKTCEFLGTIGSGVIDPMLKALIELHDNKCRVEEYDLKKEEPLLEERMVPIRYIDAVVFNRKYRPNGMADEAVWQALERPVGNRLRELDSMENVAIVMQEHHRCTAIENRWRGQAKRAISKFFTRTKKCHSLQDFTFGISRADRNGVEVCRRSLPDAVFERLVHQIGNDLFAKVAKSA